MQGAKGLATAELLAILLGTGQGPGKLSAIGLGQYILQELSQHQHMMRHKAGAADGDGPEQFHMCPTFAKHKPAPVVFFQ